jgi:hypothetical protein
MKKQHILLILGLLVITGCTKNYFKPQVWEGDPQKVSVTRGSMHTTFDTASVADEHCSKFGKMAKLVEEVNIWELPNTDKYACIDP